MCVRVAAATGSTAHCFFLDSTSTKDAALSAHRSPETIPPTRPYIHRKTKSSAQAHSRSSARPPQSDQSDHQKGGRNPGQHIAPKRRTLTVSVRRLAPRLGTGKRPPKKRLIKKNKIWNRHPQRTYLCSLLKAGDEGLKGPPNKQTHRTTARTQSQHMFVDTPAATTNIELRKSIIQVYACMCKAKHL